MSAVINTSTIFTFSNWIYLPVDMFGELDKKDLGLITELPVHPECFITNFPKRYALSVKDNIFPYIHKLIDLGFESEIPEKFLIEYENKLEKLKIEAEFNKLKRDGINTLFDKWYAEFKKTSGIELRPYQVNGCKFLLTHKKENNLSPNALGGILCLDVGLGKTLTALHSYKFLVDEYNIDGVIVVSPKNVMQEWVKEGEKLGLKFEAVHKPQDYAFQFNKAFNSRFPSANGKLNLVINYYHSKFEVLNRLLDKYPGKLFLMILDEGHTLANEKSLNHKAASKLLENNKIIAAWELTATPITNGYAFNLFGQLKLLKHHLGISRRQFEKVFCDAKEKTIFVPGMLGGGTVKTFTDNKGFSNLELLKEKLSDILFYVSKEDALKQDPFLKLPEKIIEVRYLEEDEKFTNLFNSLIKECEEEYLDLVSLNVRSEFGWQLRLIQKMLEASSIVKIQSTLELVLERLSTNSESKLIVFSSFVETTKQISNLLSQAIPSLCITGELSQKQRDSIVNTFQTDPNHRVLVGSSKSIGEGLNLQSADTVILHDVNFRLLVNVQSLGRIVRLGQKADSVNIFFQLFGELDKKVYDQYLIKDENSRRILEGKSLLPTLTDEQLAANILSSYFGRI